MLLKTSTSPVLAVSVADAKAHCRVDHDDEDSLFEELIRAATRLLEERAGIFAVPVDLELRRTGWVSDIELNAAPVRDVTAVTYLDAENAEQEVPAANWYWVRTETGATVYLDRSAAPSQLSERVQNVRVSFQAGYDDPAALEPSSAQTAVDERIAQAIKVIVGHWFENREAVLIGSSSKDIELSFEALVRQLRIFR